MPAAQYVDYIIFLLGIILAILIVLYHLFAIEGYVEKERE